MPPIRFREILEAYYGEKVSRIDCHEDILNKVIKNLENLGINFLIADFKVIESYVENKGSWHNLGERVPLNDRRKGLNYIYLGNNIADVLQAKEADEKYDSDLLGYLLDIPLCCRQFFKEKKAIALERYDDEYAVLILDNSKRLIHPHLNNYLSQYFNYSLISFFPCRFECQESLKRAERGFSLLNRYSPNLAEQFLQGSRNIIIFENRKGIHGVNGVINDDFTVKFDPTTLVSTNCTEISNLLRRNNTIYVINAQRFLIGENYIGKVLGLDQPTLFLFTDNRELYSR